jgi:hypothetical protein
MLGLPGKRHFGDDGRKAAKLEREDHLGIEDQARYPRNAEDRSSESHAGIDERRS